MKNELITVIIPIYNLENFLKNSIESVINQTYKNLEIILVNDGSTDNSRQICENFLKIDSRIKLIDISNNGVSHARNVGIDKANGDFIIFIDGDDYLKLNMLEMLYKNAVAYNADISICNSINITEEGKIIYQPKYNDETKVMVAENFIENIYDANYYYGYIFNKLIKKEIIKNERFDETLSHMEDWDFLLRIAANASQIVYERKDYYYYHLVRKNSAVNEKFNEKWITELTARKKISTYVSKFKHADREMFYYDYITYIMNLYNYYYYNSLLNAKNKKEINNLKKDILSKMKKIYYLPKNKIIKMKLKCYFPLVYCWLLNFKRK